MVSTIYAIIGIVFLQGVISIILILFVCSDKNLRSLRYLHRYRVYADYASRKALKAFDRCANSTYLSTYKYFGRPAKEALTAIYLIEVKCRIDFEEGKYLLKRGLILVAKGKKGEYILYKKPLDRFAKDNYRMFSCDLQHVAEQYLFSIVSDINYKTKEMIAGVLKEYSIIDKKNV